MFSSFNILANALIESIEGLSAFLDNARSEICAEEDAAIGDSEDPVA